MQYLDTILIFTLGVGAGSALAFVIGQRNHARTAQ